MLVNFQDIYEKMKVSNYNSVQLFKISCFIVVKLCTLNATRHMHSLIGTKMIKC